MNPARPKKSNAAQPKRARRILIVDDHPVMRQAMIQMLSDQSDLEVCGEADGTASALQLLKQTSPDAMIIDLTLNECHGLELIKQVRAIAPTVRLLVYSMHDASLYAERVIRAGASGYLNKSAPAAEVLVAVRTVLDHHTYLQPEIMSRMLTQHGSRARSTTDSPLDQLSDRELEVFEQLGRGASTHQIAEHMHISSKTVDVYRQRLKTKLQITENNELIRHAVESASILPPPPTRTK